MSTNRLQGYGSTVEPIMVPNCSFKYSDLTANWELRGRAEGCTILLYAESQAEVINKWKAWLTRNRESDQSLDPEF